ncbi:MAG: H/ACA ribonucleoprotein complex subunit GAR1 [Acidilobaceae archaeon]
MAKLRFKPLGKVKNVTNMGLIVVSMIGRKPIPLGSKVYYRAPQGSHPSTGGLIEAGKIIDIIGNVERPYAVVKIANDRFEEVGEGLELLYEPWRPSRPRRGGRRGGR